MLRPLIVIASLFSVLPTSSLLAQDLDPVRVERRVGKLESELRAVQRKVFPGGDARYFEPEINAPAAAAPASIGSPASQPITDLSNRVGELERQLRDLTGQIEANQFKLRQLDEAQAKLRGDLEFRLTGLEGGGQPAAAAAPGAQVLPPPPGTRVGAPEIDFADRPVPAPRPATPAAPAATADAAWKQAYAKSLSKNWPETEIAMTDFIAAWPKSTRVPQAQYWLGRSHAERGQNAEAARAFLELYKTAPRSDRAPDSLLGLATAMNGLKKPKDACRVLGELGSVYGEKLTPAQKSESQALGTRAKCAA
ncbi:hypothetical protein GCM10011529_13830 [Polymorphobacter glacialis]|uniref:YbgF trimerisation domain-containing protein n=1 Tax=Sandarakinorhabdus glacialis TaxID=1614636 RepID=A0A916ZQ43_9SPHN|nr:YbgF trimerization domain-containing protein [Polymorphobacter glacialis]GGE08635.1 hypothetical protein GCM10011529_13830 [Polymorphobacter glacialis]